MKVYKMKKDNYGRIKKEITRFFTKKIYNPFFRELIFFFLYNKIRPAKRGYTIFSMGGIGDIFLNCILLKAFKDKFGGKLKLVVKSHMTEIANMFTYAVDDIIPVKYNQRDFSSCFYRKTFAEDRFVLAHPCQSYFENTKPLLGYKNINLLDICKLTLNLDFKAEISMPVIDEKYRISAEEKFKNHHLRQGKTVIIAPEARTVEVLGVSFWKELVKELKEKGYDVFLNAIDKDSIFDGVEYEFVSFGEIIPFANLCGHVISVRSGLCDILAVSDCRLHVIYPRQQYYKFSLNGMFEKETIQEYVMGADNKNAIEAILKNF